MKSYNVFPDLTASGLGNLAQAVKDVAEGKTKRVDLGRGTTVGTMPTNNPKSTCVVIFMEIEEEE